jgi:hypothetical protein
MRASACVCLVVGVSLALGAGPPRRGGRIAELVKQLGDDEFVKREAASKALEGIGEPALPALRKAAGSADLEVRRRAGRAIGVIAAAAGKKELARWEGDWKDAAGVWMKFRGERWSSGTPTFGPVGGTIKIVEVGEKVTLADLAVDAGPTRGGTVLAIFRRDGDTLQYCGTYTATRPTEFKTAGNHYSVAFTRVKK